MVHIPPEVVPQLPFPQEKADKADVIATLFFQPSNWDGVGSINMLPMVSDHAEGPAHQFWFFLCLDNNLPDFVNRIYWVHGELVQSNQNLLDCGDGQTSM